MVARLKVHFTDFPGPTNPDAMLRLLRRRHQVELDPENPDLVFYSVCGYEFLKFKKAIRIFFTGENIHPDFNLCDYALGFDWLTLEDRYFRCPNFLLYEEYEELLTKKPLTIQQITEIQRRPRFCNFIYSNSQAHPFRDKLFNLLNTQKKVDSAGLHLNNTGFFRGSPRLGVAGTQDKIEFQKECRFTLAIENSSTPGYTTEKLIHALVADTIPIYWGDPMVGRQFNSNRIVNCHEYSSISDIVKRIIEIEQNQQLSASILQEPIFNKGLVPGNLVPSAVLEFLESFIGKPADLARRRNLYFWARKYEDRRRREVFWDQAAHGSAYRWLKRKIKKILGIKSLQ